VIIGFEKEENLIHDEVGFFLFSEKGGDEKGGKGLVLGQEGADWAALENAMFMGHF